MKRSLGRQLPPPRFSTVLKLEERSCLKAHELGICGAACWGLQQWGPAPTTASRIGPALRVPADASTHYVKLRVDDGLTWEAAKARRDAAQADLTLRHAPPHRLKKVRMCVRVCRCVCTVRP